MSVQVTYDPVADAAFVKVGDGPICDTLVVTDRINLDFDADGRLVSIEVLETSKTAPRLAVAPGRAAIAAE